MHTIQHNKFHSQKHYSLGLLRDNYGCIHNTPPVNPLSLTQYYCNHPLFGLSVVCVYYNTYNCSFNSCVTQESKLASCPSGFIIVMCYIQKHACKLLLYLLLVVILL